MGRKNRIGRESTYEGVETQSLSKEVGALHFTPIEKILNVDTHFSVIGNCRVKNLNLEIRLNNNGEGSTYLSVPLAEIESCFENNLTVAYIYQRDNLTLVDGACRASKSGKGLNCKLTKTGRLFTIARHIIRKCIEQPESYIGNVIEFDNNGDLKNGN